MAHETNSRVKCGAKLFRLFDYRQSNSWKTKRIIASTRMQNSFLEKIFLIYAGIIFFPMNIVKTFYFD
jgi:hypothetical protein